LSRWLISKSAQCDDNSVIDVLSEIYVFNVLNKLSRESKVYPELPTLAACGKGEIDFLLRSMDYDAHFALEVKCNDSEEKRNGSVEKTYDKALKDGMVNYVVILQDEGPFGNFENVFAFPIYLLETFNFDLGNLRHPWMYEDFLEPSQ
jgi:hypothetical protein